MEEEMEEILENLQLSKYIQKFKEKQITSQNLFLLDEIEISELIPDVEDRYRFVLFRESKRNENSLIEVKYEDLESNADVGSPVENVVYDFNLGVIPSLSNNHPGNTLKTLLKRTIIGRTLMKRKTFNDRDRKKLCEIIIGHLLNNSMTVKRDEFLFWAREVGAVVTHEDPSHYYSCNKSRKNPNGKLYDYYTNLKKWINREKGHDDEKQEPQQKVEDNNSLEELQNLSLENDRILQLWRDTFKLRNRGLTIAEYYDAYQVLNLPIGIKLLEDDFHTILKIDPGRFSSEWPKFSTRVLLEAGEFKVCEDFLSLESVPDDILGLFVLPYLFKPTFIRAKSKKHPEVWKASKAEIAEGFIFRVPTLADLEPNWEKRLDKLKKFEITQQPIIIAVGPIEDITAVYVCVNNVRYECSDLMEGVDLCFKTFFALNAEYPSDSRPVWEFIQRLYGIEFSEKYKCSTNASIVWRKISSK